MNRPLSAWWAAAASPCATAAAGGRGGGDAWACKKLKVEAIRWVAAEGSGGAGRMLEEEGGGEGGLGGVRVEALLFVYICYKGFSLMAWGFVLRVLRSKA